MSRARVACVLPAQDQTDTVAATVAAAVDLSGIDIVIVCDDGSTDDTGRVAAAAGAIVVTHRRTRGRAAALESGVNALGVLEQRDRRPECGTLLLLDAALGPAAAGLGPLVRSVGDDDADLAVATTQDGTRGVVASTAARGIAELTGWTPTAPLSPYRCLTRRAYELASPLASGGGADVGMTIDLLKAGLRVRELPLELPVPADADDLRTRLDQARQLRDVTRALTARGLVQSGWQDLKDRGGVGGLLKRLRP